MEVKASGIMHASSKDINGIYLHADDMPAVHVFRQHPFLLLSSKKLVQAFQKLIYVSTIVFGERRAAFLLPWRRVFSLTDAQLSVAKRDNAKALFNNHIQSLGGELQVCNSTLEL